jgi:hypothetical protein
MPADSARFLAATSAGQREYNDVVSLGQDLLNQGQRYEEVKDYETANSIYNAVRELGVQVEQGALLSNERLAGYDLQMGALDAVARVAEILKTPEGLQIIEGTYNVLADSLTGFVDYLGAVGQYLNSATPSDAGQIGSQILTQGDLNLPVTTTQP